MELENGFYDVPMGKLATVVTYLEMRTPVMGNPVSAPTGCTLRQVSKPSAAWYKDLFKRVGASDWLWFSRLALPDDALEDILHDPAVHVYALSKDNQDMGLLELDFRQPKACELAFFGVAKAMIGTGAGRFMMNQAVRLAWSNPIDLFHVHTCTLDSPQALPFYLRAGFKPVRQQIEIADDPRLIGLIETSAAPQIPIFAPTRANTP